MVHDILHFRLDIEPRSPRHVRLITDAVVQSTTVFLPFREELKKEERDNASEMREQAEFLALGVVPHLFYRLI